MPILASPLPLWISPKYLNRRVGHLRAKLILLKGSKMEPREGHETPPSSPSRARCLSTYVLTPWFLLIDGALPKILIESTTKNNFEYLQRLASFCTIRTCPATTLIWSSPDCFGTPLSYIELLLSTNCWQFSVCVGESTWFAPKWGLEIEWLNGEWLNTLCLAEQEPDNVGRKILATGEEPLKVRVISRHSFRLISLLKILVGLTKTQAKGKHNSAVRARHSSNRQTPIWPFGVYVSLAFFRAWSRNNLHWLLT